MTIIEKAQAFAIERHGPQLRKYTGEPYWFHLRNVAGIVQEVTQDEETIAAAWLHDVLEDTETKIREVEERFGGEVLRIVLALTDCTSPVLNRAREESPRP